jgi:hypothetical protein
MSLLSTLTLGLLSITPVVIRGQTTNDNVFYDGSVCIENVGSNGKFIGASREMDDFCSIQFDINMVQDAPACKNKLCFSFKNRDLDTNNIYLSNELFLTDRITASSKEIWYIDPTSTDHSNYNIKSVVPNRSGRTLLCRNIGIISADIQLRKDNSINRGLPGCQWKLQKPTKRRLIDLVENDGSTINSEIQPSTDENVAIEGIDIEGVDLNMLSSNSNNRGFCVQVQSERSGKYLFLGLKRQLDRRCITRWNFEGLAGGSPGQQNFALSTVRNRPKLWLSALPDRLGNLSDKPERFILRRAASGGNLYRYNFINSYDDDEFNGWGILCQERGKLLYKETNKERDLKTCQWLFSNN